MSEPGRNIIRPMFGRKITISKFFCPSLSRRRWKKLIFSIFSKFVQNMFRYQILVRNGSTVPQVHIFGHIMTFRPHPATLNKFLFLTFFGQNRQFEHFHIFIIWDDILPKVVENIIYALKCVLWVPKTLLHT